MRSVRFCRLLAVMDEEMSYPDVLFARHCSQFPVSHIGTVLLFHLKRCGRLRRVCAKNTLITYTRGYIFIIPH